MRKALISLLLASAAASPALAARPDSSDRQAAREDRQQQSREDRQQAREDRQTAREEHSSNQQPRPPERSFEPRPQQSFQPQSYQRPAQPNFGGAADVRSVEALRARQQGFEAQREQRAGRLQQLRDNRDLRQSTRPLPNVMRGRTPVVSEVPRFGTQPPRRVEQNRAPVQWSSNWRHDNRYDWKNYRDRHRSVFHLGFYYDPFGWGYQPYSIGWRLWPNYYSSNFWINDPGYYRLPYAPPGTQWIRYYDDAILVDMWSGQVVDVIHDFFW